MQKAQKYPHLPRKHCGEIPQYTLKFPQSAQHYAGFRLLILNIKKNIVSLAQVLLRLYGI